MHEVEIWSRSLEEARKTAAFQLGVSEDEIELEVVEEVEPQGNATGRRCHVRARIRPDAFSPHAEKEMGDHGEREPWEGQDRAIDVRRFSLATQSETREDDSGAASEPEPVIQTGAHGRVEEPAYIAEAEKEAAYPGEPPQDVADRARQFLQGLLTILGLKAEAIIRHVGHEEVLLEIRGQDLGFLIGRYGSCLDALQLLTAAAANRGVRTGARVVVDAEGYRERRRASLERLALSTAAKVKRTGREIEIPNLQAHERRVIHMVLRDDPNVETHSEGEGRHRRLVVSPRRGRRPE